MASGAYTHAHTHAHTRAHAIADKSDYKKPGAPACGRRAWFKNSIYSFKDYKICRHTENNRSIANTEHYG